MTETELKKALSQAAREGATKAIELHAAAIRSQMPQANSSPSIKVTTPKVGIGHWIAIVSLALTLVGGIIPWCFGISSRMSVVEAKLVSDDEKLGSIDKALEDLAALKQELTDFRGDFRDWKRENGFGTPVARQMPPH